MNDVSFSQSTALADADLVNQLIDDIGERAQAGESVDIEEYCAAHPECAGAIREIWPAVQAMASIKTAESSPDQALPQALGDFRVVRQIGRGGMGVVYEAEQLSLGRRVALKILPYAAMLDERALARFRNEARAAATLFHPHIVPIFFVGSERGVHFYAMQLIEGQSLSEVLQRMRTASGGPADGQDTAPHHTAPESEPHDTVALYAVNLLRLWVLICTARATCWRVAVSSMGAPGGFSHFLRG